MAITPERASELRQALHASFSPNAPIRLPDLLRGRRNEIQRTIRAIETKGEHAVVFGDRGVGKTSIGLVTAAISQEPHQRRGRRALIASCSTNDNFATIWKKVLDEILTVEKGLGFAETIEYTSGGRLSISLEDLQSPNDIRLIVSSLPNPSIIILDEFDRVSNEDTRTQISETIKLFGDHEVNSTIVIVGVADDVSQLMEAHRSIGRHLAEIQVTPLSHKELSEIVQGGLSNAGMTWAIGVPHDIAQLCHGYPNYAHLIGRSAGQAALEAQRTEVELEDVQAAIDEMIENSLQSLRGDYERAVASPQPDTLFREVLLACALAEKDSLGRFAAADVRIPLRKITGRSDYDIPNFQSHLAKFIDQSRGPVLRREGRPRSYRYRFVDPRMIPYVTLQGTNNGQISIRDAQGR